MANEPLHIAGRRVQFGLFEADLKSGELRRSGVRLRVQSQPFKLLAALLEQPGEVVSREALQQRLWDAETTVDFDNLHPIAATEYRLIGLAPGDLPVVSARTATVNFYTLDLNEH